MRQTTANVSQSQHTPPSLRRGGGEEKNIPTHPPPSTT
ncbi:hypothetical protein FAMCQIZV_CDS0032 [Phage C72C1]|nr:hypothetical protein FAMCQIZV_CDS0032 [Phage C72C1]